MYDVDGSSFFLSPIKIHLPPMSFPPSLSLSPSLPFSLSPSLSLSLSLSLTLSFTHSLSFSLFVFPSPSLPPSLLGPLPHRYGHQDGISAIDCLARERPVTAGMSDRTVRVWKVVQESQLVFSGHKSVLD